MRVIDEATAEALDGSRAADTLTVWAWRGGTLVLPEPLRVSSWSREDRAGDSVKVGQRLTLTIADPEGVLGAWRLDDPLGVAGTRLQVIYRVGGAFAVNLGWFRIVDNNPTEVVDSRMIAEYGLIVPDSPVEPHSRRKYVVGAEVQIEAVDLTADVDRDRLESPESPQPGATVLSEFRRLTEKYFPTVVDDGVTDTGVSTKLIFDRERLEACQDLLTRVGARYRMGGDGECRVYPRHGAPVWRVEPTAGLVSVAREQSIEGLYNKWVVEGKDAETGVPILASATLESGPLRYGGPHGRIPYFYSSEMIATYAQAVAYAAVLRDEFMNSLAIELSVTTIPRPELQAGDWIEVGCPMPAGHVAYLAGEIVAIRAGGSPTPGHMNITVACAYSDVVVGLMRTDWAKDLTAERPELTWARLPGTWGSLPSIPWTDLP